MLLDAHLANYVLNRVLLFLKGCSMALIQGTARLQGATQVLTRYSMVLWKVGTPFLHLLAGFEPVS